jgi:uncharacterized protein
MSADLNCTIQQLMSEKEWRKQIVLQKYVTEKTGLPTLSDILTELDKPGRDPRKSFELFAFDNSVHEIADLRVGMRLPGIVTNVTNFGAFVDIGVHQDGLVHVSQLSNTFVDDPNKVVKVQQHVMVTVTEVDAQRKRIALSMKDAVTSSTSSHNPIKNNTVNNNNKNKKGVAPVENDFASQLAALRDKFN